MADLQARPITVLVTACEASGDRLGAALIRAMRQRLPGQELRFIGIGGREMEREGVSSLFNIAQLSILGFYEGLKAYPRVVARANDIRAMAEREKPDIAVLIDSWGFSLRVAHRLRKLKPPVHVVKFVGPQIWASRPGRAKVLAKAVDHLLSTQSMDSPFYAPLGLPVTFVGNPALALDVSNANAARARQELGLGPDQPLLLVLPGSRPSEIARLAADFGDAVARLKADRPDLAVVVPVADTVAARVRAAVSHWPVQPVFIDNDRLKLDAMAACTVALACSGTVTTELALCGAPMVVAYRLGRLSYAAAKLIITTKYITLFNIAAGREIAPEFVQDACSGEALAKAVALRLDDPQLRRAQVEAQTAALVQMGRGGGDPSDKAAEAIIQDLRQIGRISGAA
jgi:lipid-A-disaccharide synthase